MSHLEAREGEGFLNTAQDRTAPRHYCSFGTPPWLPSRWVKKGRRVLRGRGPPSPPHPTHVLFFPFRIRNKKKKIINLVGGGEGAFFFF